MGLGLVGGGGSSAVRVGPGSGYVVMVLGVTVGLGGSVSTGLSYQAVSLLVPRPAWCCLWCVRASGPSVALLAIESRQFATKAQSNINYEKWQSNSITYSVISDAYVFEIK